MPNEITRLSGKIASLLMRTAHRELQNELNAPLEPMLLRKNAALFVRAALVSIEF